MKKYLIAIFFSIILESKFRIKKLQVEKVVNILNIKPGHTIADIGAGTGLFSKLFARATQPGGIVYAVDTNPVLLKKIEKKKKKKKIDNLKSVLASVEDFNLPEPVDIMFMCDVLHHVENKSNFLNNVHKYLKHDGIVAIIDFNEKWPPFHKSMKFSMNEYEGWIKIAGLKLVEKYDFLVDSIGSFFHIYRAEES
jgi:ubiquinone/menaquinone biosynthesis C-methylase UbiE